MLVLTDVQIKEIQKKIGYNFKKRKRLEVIFCHSSFANVNKLQSYERYEFLGDSVLNLTVTEHLYATNSGTEGELTQKRQTLVCESSLVTVCKKLDIVKYLQIGKGQQLVNSIIGDLYEAVVGAIFIDGGYKKAQKFIASTLLQ